jgi:guanine nucleotide-binding protein subunit alpha
MLIISKGAGESGKSTIIKQMRIIHSGGFPEDERRQNRAVIYSNLVVAFKVLMEIMQTQKIEFEKESNKVCSLCCPRMDLAANVVQPLGDLLAKTEADVDTDEAFSDIEIKQAMTDLWSDSGVQQAVARGHEFALHDNLH